MFHIETRAYGLGTLRRCTNYKLRRRILRKRILWFNSESGDLLKDFRIQIKIIVIWSNTGIITARPIRSRVCVRWPPMILFIQWRVIDWPAVFWNTWWWPGWVWLKVYCKLNWSKNRYWWQVCDIDDSSVTNVNVYKHVTFGVWKKGTWIDDESDWIGLGTVSDLFVWLINWGTNPPWEFIFNCNSGWTVCEWIILWPLWSFQRQAVGLNGDFRMLL